MADITYTKILVTLILIVSLYIAIKIVNTLLKNIEEKTKKANNSDLVDIVPFLSNVIKIIVTAAFGLATLKYWGVDISPLLASAGVAGLAVAFAAKDSISNLFGGLSILIDKPYRVGDMINIENTRGEVLLIGARSTKIKTLNNMLITVPNAIIVNTAVINETGVEPMLRINVPVEVAYSSDLQRVEELLLEVMRENEKVLSEPEPLVRFTSFADSGIQVSAIAAVENPLQKGIVTHELIKDIHKKFNEKGIEIPFPQRDVHLKTPLNG